MEQKRLGNLEPKKVFSFFEEMCAIPHGSGNTKAISDYCMAFAERRGLRTRQDDKDNVIIWKAGSAGYENHPAVIVQGHLDMVCAKEKDCPIDMETEGLSLVVQDGFVSAEGTTLGGDDGIAVAMALAILDDDTIPHPPLEAVFTSDEEIGLLGASALDCSDLQGRMLLNIDSEEEGHLTVGCAGGSRCDMTAQLAGGHGCGAVCTLELSGFAGGHSGIEIDKGRANTNKLMGELLLCLAEEFPVQLMQLSGGKFDNAIPNHTTATLLVDAGSVEAVKARAEKWWQETSVHYAQSDANGTLTAAPGGELCGSALTPEDTRRMAEWITKIPNGVRAMSKDMPELVETSSNLGILKLSGSEFRVTVSVRSSLNHVWKEQMEELHALASQYGAVFYAYGDYPAWEYRKESILRPLMAEVYQELYGKQPSIAMTHGGLECGIFSDKLPGLDCVSFGPDLFAVHTPQERLSIASVERTWRYLLEILRRL